MSDSSTTHFIDTRCHPWTGKVTARCLGKHVQATSVTGALCAVEACAKKLALGRAYTLREFTRYTWRCDVACTHTPASAVQKPEDMQP